MLHFCDARITCIDTVHIIIQVSSNEVLLTLYKHATAQSENQILVKLFRLITGFFIISLTT